MASSRREREKVISEYRAKASERKEFQEKVERRVSSIGAYLKAEYKVCSLLFISSSFFYSCR